MTGKIFINYRRGDDPGNTGRLFDRLQDVFPPQQLFLDVDNIAPGLDFIRVLDERVGECDILLAVIGKSWINARDPMGNRRLDDPEDFVRIEIEAALKQDKRVIPVLVGDAAMPSAQDLPPSLQPLARRNALRLTHERFRADTQGLVKALQQALAEIDARNEARVRAEAERQAEEERRRQEAEAARQAEETARKQKAEAEAREHAAAERRRQEEAARQRVVAEQAFAAARRANTIAAIEAFEKSYPDSHVAAEAKALKAALMVRQEAYRSAMASDELAALWAFCDVYRTGTDVSEVRVRLRLLQPRRSWQPAAPTVVVATALIVVVIGAALGYWLERRSPAAPQVAAGPSPAPALSVPAPVPTQLAAISAVKPATQASSKPSSPPAIAAPAPAPTAPAPPPAPAAPALDQVAWSLLTDTNDAAALQRFIAQFPDSKLRQNAEARIAAIAVAQAAKVATSTEQIAWGLVKDSKVGAELHKFLDQFPDSGHRAEAEQLIAALPSEPNTAVAKAPDRYELTRALQFELHRVGCFNGTVNGQFDDPTKAAWHQFTKLASLDMPDDASSDAVKAVRAVNKRVCPLVCQGGQHAEGDICVANAPPPGSRPSALPAQQPQRGNTVVDARGLPVGTVIPGGTTTCGPNGCQNIPKNCHAVKMGRNNPQWKGLGGKIICP